MAYAAGTTTNTPSSYSKLVGLGAIGPVGGDPNFDTNCVFVITNTDSVGNITILSMRLYDATGTKVADGPPTEATGWTSLPHDLGPHQIIALPFETDFGYPAGVYTLDVGWQAKAGTCPLSGEVVQHLYNVTSGSVEETTTQMVNVQQVLK